MTVYIEDLRAYTSPSGVEIAASGWSNDNTPYFKMTEPSGILLRGYSISIVEPGDVETDVPDEDQITQEDIDEAYEQFKEIIVDAHKSGDITNFLFINTDTNMQIEDEAHER